MSATIDVTRDRGRGLGSSDSYRIMNGDWLSLYNEKLGITEPEDLSHIFRVQLGIYTEAFHLKWLADEYGIEHTIPAEVHERKLEESNCLLFSHLDAITPEGIPIEVKHTNGFATIDKMMDTYAAQLHHHMYVLGTDRIIFSFIAGNDAPQYHIVSYDQEYGDELRKRQAAFWRYVEEQEPPEADMGEAPVKARPDVDGMRTIDNQGNNEWAFCANAFVEHQEASKLFDAAKKNLRELVPNDARLVTGHGVTASRTKAGSIIIKADKT